MKEYQLPGAIASVVTHRVHDTMVFHDIIARFAVSAQFLDNHLWATLDDMVCDGDIIAVYFSSANMVRTEAIYFPGSMRVSMSDEEFRRN